MTPKHTKPSPVSNGQAFHHLIDPYGRRLRYLRLSLTEACNLSCTYCLPEGFPEWYKHRARLGMAELTSILGGFQLLGFRKVRLTGGEPTLHLRCRDTVREAQDWGYEKIALTTNGLLIRDLKPWISAGLTDINISLDALDQRTFHEMTKNKDVTRVLKLVDAACDAGIGVKINTVLMRSINGDHTSITSLIDWALERPLTLRFIELMDTGLNKNFASRERVSGQEILPFLEQRGLSRWTPGPDEVALAGPATDYHSPEHSGRIGLINPLSCNFCSSCNRLRVTARGRLRLCLFGELEHNLDLSSAQAVALNVRRLIGTKPERHYLDEGRHGSVATFRTIGG